MKMKITRKDLTTYLSKGYSAGQIANIQNMSTPTVKRIVREDHPQLLTRLLKNGKANHGGARR